MSNPLLTRLSCKFAGKPLIFFRDSYLDNTWLKIENALAVHKELIVFVLEGVDDDTESDRRYDVVGR